MRSIFHMRSGPDPWGLRTPVRWRGWPRNPSPRSVRGSDSALIAFEPTKDLLACFVQLIAADLCKNFLHTRQCGPESFGAARALPPIRSYLGFLFFNAAVFGCLGKCNTLVGNSWDKKHHVGPGETSGERFPDKGPRPWSDFPEEGSAVSCTWEACGHAPASGLFLVSDNCRKMLFSLKMCVYLTRFLFASQSGFYPVSYHSN